MNIGVAMESKLIIGDILSKEDNKVNCMTQRETNNTYMLPSEHVENFSSRRFGDHVLTFCIDYKDDIKEVGYTYSKAFYGEFIFGDVKVVNVVKNDDYYRVFLLARKIAITSLNL